MSKPLQYSMTNDTVTVFLEGEAHAVTKGAPNYLALRQSIFAENWEAVPGLLSAEQAVEKWLETPAGAGKAKVSDQAIMVDGEKLPPELHDRVLKMMAKGEEATPILNFWKRLKRNPNPHSVNQLWGFLAHVGIPLQPDGTFLAYKGVRQDFRDQHSGKFDNSPGKTIRMARDKISTDPETACHEGLHVGAMTYATGFAAQTVVVRVDPEHVCCVPNDHSAQKMRVCEYTVLGVHGQQMPSTTFEADVPSTPPAPVTGTEWDHFNGMSAEVLADQSIADLRKYARHNCQISNPNSIPGGKQALLAKILETRTKETEPLAPDQPVATKIPLIGTEWDWLNKVPAFDLLKESLEDLRRYARANCLIVGASKLPGGKNVLVSRIAAARGEKSA